MFNNYKIKEDVLYLYVLDNCEIGSLFNKDKNEDIIHKIKSYIKDNKINFNGTKVVLLLSGLMLGTVYLNDKNDVSYAAYRENKYAYNTIDKKEIVESKIDEIIDGAFSNIPNKKGIITLKRTNGEVININIEEYLIGVVSAEMPASFNMEALKAQAVVARTYTLKLLESGRTITDDVSTQVYKSNDELKSIWGNMYDNYYQKVKSAVDDTKNKCIKYNGSLIDAIYHSISNGYTDDAVNVWGNSIPYLKIVTSPWDTSASSFLRDTNIDFNKISNVLGTDFSASSIIEIVSRDESGRIAKIRFNDKEFTGVEIRKLLGLRSTDFDVLINENNVTFTTRGYGHGVGMSQYGANKMAKVGYTYEQILKHYYSGIYFDISY